MSGAMSASSKASVLLLRRTAPRLLARSPALPPPRRASPCGTGQQAKVSSARGRWYSASASLLRDAQRGREGDGVPVGGEGLVDVGAEGGDAKSEGVEGTAGAVPGEDRDFAFAFDIDGVLLHSSKALPGAAETLRFLQEHKIPFILLTNGGGKSEAERVAELSVKLGVSLDTSNLVQSHTPYRLIPNSQDLPGRDPLLSAWIKKTFGDRNLRTSTVLVLGSDASKARSIALEYGFESVVTPGDILKACPEIFPFNPLHEFYDKQNIMPLPKPIYDPNNPSVKLEDCLKIDAILVFNDPRDWAVDIQLITDLLVSHQGYLGTYSSKNRDRSLHHTKQWQNDGQPPLVFSNRDVLWSTGYHMPRYGQGAFLAAVDAAFREVVVAAGPPFFAHKIKQSWLGKPRDATYAFAEEVLDQYTVSLHAPPASNVYMVGDNPSSDILGANRRRMDHEKANEKKNRGEATDGEKAPARPARSWTSCLVKTGVWSEDRAPAARLPWRQRPQIVQPDVKSTVNYVLEKHGWTERVE